MDSFFRQKMDNGVRPKKMPHKLAKLNDEGMKDLSDVDSLVEGNKNLGSAANKKFNLYNNKYASLICIDGHL